MRRYFLKLALAGVVAATAACSLILGSSGDQCSTDGDCARFAAYPVCTEGVCVARAIEQDGNVPPVDSPALPDVVESGCPPVPAGAQIDFANACTTGQCIDFDNCARLGQAYCNGGALPALIPPPDAAPPPPDSGPDANDSATD